MLVTIITGSPGPSSTSQSVSRLGRAGPASGKLVVGRKGGIIIIVLSVSFTHNATLVRITVSYPSVNLAWGGWVGGGGLTSSNTKLEPFYLVFYHDRRSSGPPQSK